MKKLILLSLLSMSFTISFATANDVSDCNPGAVVTLLTHSTHSAGDLVGDKTYGVVINGHRALQLDIKTAQTLRNATISNTKTRWIAASNPAYAYCEVTLKTGKNNLRVDLFPNTHTNQLSWIPWK